MKKCFVCAVLWLCVPAPTGWGGLPQGSSDLPTTVPTNSYGLILSTIAGKKGTFLLTTWEQQDVSETRVHVLECDLTGRIQHANEFTVSRGLFISGTHDPHIPVIWINTIGLHGPAELSLAEYSEHQLQTKLLLRQRKKDDFSLQKCWLLRAGGKKKLFVQEYTFIKKGQSTDLEFTQSYRLSCYALEKDGLKLQGEAPIGQTSIGSLDDISAECAVVEGTVYVWVRECTGRWPASSVLRVAPWRDDGKLQWSEQYKGGYVNPVLSIDPLDGSAVAILEQHLNRPYSSAIVCQSPGHMPPSVNLGYGFGGKHQLLRVQEAGVSWLLLNYEAWNMRILALNQKLQKLKRIDKAYPNTTDLHLVRGDNRAIYTVILSEAGHITIEKLEGLAATTPVKEQVEQTAFEELSHQMIDAAYKQYMQGNGKNLLKATDDQLAEDIVSGNTQSISPLISYYRLLLRDEKRAKKCLSRQLKEIVKEGLGKEHWIIHMQLAFYGEPAIEPLLAIAASKNREERRIAVGALCSMPDSTVVTKLLELLEKPQVRKDMGALVTICDVALRTGKPQAIEFLIEAASRELVEKHDYRAEWSRDRAREMLIEITRQYQDTPKGWSEPEWNEWLKNHWPSFKENLERHAKETIKPQQAKRPHPLFEKLAEKLEQDK